MTFNGGSGRAAARISSEAEMEKAIDFVLRNDVELETTDIGNLRLPKASAEAVRCLEIKNILQEHAGRGKVSCPLSVAVFGPPGQANRIL